MEVSKTSSAAFLLFLGVLVGLMASPSEGYVFYVGGRSGWTLSPSESYGHWAERNRFQINDTLVFKYKKGENSVLLVRKEDYDSCNIQNPIAKMDGGDSTFVFNRSGPFYFISGVPEDCNKSQKLTVVVMAPRNKKPSPPPAPGSSPPAHPPVPSPSPPSIKPAPGNAPVPGPSPSAITPPSPQAQPPAQAPSAPSPHASGSPAPTPSTTKSSSSVFRSPVVLILFMALGTFLM